VDPPAGQISSSGQPVPLARALADLDRLVAARPDLASLGPRIAGILVATFQTPGSVRPALEPGFDETAFLLDRIREGWNGGVPAVRVVPPSFDPPALLARLSALDACADSDPNAPRNSRVFLECDPDAVMAWAGTLLTEGAERLSADLGHATEQPNYVVSVLRLGLLGELADWSGRVASQLGETDWHRGHCPVCGAAPSLAEARGLEQRRFLRCGLCGAGWPASRGRCPFCAQSDPRAALYVAAEEDHGRCRLVLCETCGGKLKVIATLAPLSAPGLVVAELATLHLDFVAGADATTTAG
jgi:hypothetical protein